MAIVAACALVIPVSQHGIALSPVENAFEGAAVGLILVSLYATYRRVKVYIRGDTSRTASLEQAARMKGASLVANTLRHRVLNKLAVAAGYTELLADDPRLPDEVQARANMILNSTMAAARTIQTLDTLALVESSEASSDHSTEWTHHR
ncbi:MAG: hypothetical protein JOY61_13870 [Chloroflexi bacterium]|nr:hypothetical protein [Chloroflexota bacterium]